MNKETLDRMRQMRLFGMYEAFKTNLESSIKETLTPDQLVSLLVTNEWDDRRNRNIDRALKMANFRYKASVEELDDSVERGLDKNQFHRLASLDFVKEHKDLIITGSTGTGKLLSHRPRIPGLSGGLQGAVCFNGQTDGTVKVSQG